MSDVVQTDIVDSSGVIGDKLAAWILPISATQSVAVGRHELKYIEYVESLISLPGLPAFCEQGFVWRNRFVPLLNFNSLLSRRRITMNSTEYLTAIIAYENAQSELAVGAILLAGVPKLLAVNSAQSIAVTEVHQEWQLLAHAAFKDGNELYPVLDLCSLFDKTPVELLSLH